MALTAAIATLTTALATQGAALAAQGVALTAAIAAQGVALTVVIMIEGARSFNSSAILEHHTLRSVPNAAGLMPALAAPVVWYPASREIFNGGGLTNARADALLQFYALPPMAGNLQTKRAAIGAHIGVRPN